MLMMLPCGLFLGGCLNAEKPVSIQTIQKTSTSGLVDTYTIFYTDGTTSTFTITNGADGSDGQDGNDVTIEQAYNAYVEQYGSISYADFLKIYLSYNTSGNSVVINQCLQSSMKVYTAFRETTRVGLTTYQDVVEVYCGSAVIYKIDADYTYIITNYHVIYDSNANEDNGSKLAYQIFGYLYGSEGQPQETSNVDDDGYPIYDGGEYGIDCQIVGASITKDIAVLRANTQDILAINSNAKPVEFAQNYIVGETAIAIGNPEDEGISVTEGIVSVDNEFISIAIDQTVRAYRSIRIDTALYGGNSGGGLFNCNGELIGITNAGDKTDQNVNYAIPLNIVKNTVENLMYYYEQTGVASCGKKLSLGITVAAQNSKYVYDSTKGYGKIVEEVMIEEVVEGKLASQIGMQVGDRVLSVILNETEFAVDRFFEIGDVLLLARANQQIKFKILRGGETITTTAHTISATDLIDVD